MTSYPPAAEKIAGRVAKCIVYRKFEEAESVVAEGLEQFPEHPRLRCLQARLLCLKDRQTAALRVLTTHLFRVSDAALQPGTPAWATAVGESLATQFDEELTAPPGHPGYVTEGDLGPLRNIVFVLERCDYLPSSEAFAGAVSRSSQGESGAGCHGVLKAIYTARYAKNSTVQRGEELLQECVRIGDYKTAQNLANALFRTTNTKKHRMWGVECMLGQLPPDPYKETGSEGQEGWRAPRNAAEPMAGLQLQLTTKMLEKVLPTTVAHHEHPCDDGPGGSKNTSTPQYVDPTASNPGTCGAGKKSRSKNRSNDNANDKGAKSQPTAAAAALESKDPEEEGMARVSTPSMAQAYVDVLLQQAQWTEAVAFICSARGTLLAYPDRRLEMLSNTLLTIAMRMEHGGNTNPPSASSAQPTTATATATSSYGYACLASVVAREVWARVPDSWTCFELYWKAVQWCMERQAAHDHATLTGAMEPLRVMGVGPRRVTGCGDRTGAAGLSIAGEKEEKEASNPDRLFPEENIRCETLFSAADADQTFHATLSMARMLQQQENAAAEARRRESVAVDKAPAHTQRRRHQHSRKRRGPFLAELFLLQRQVEAEQAQGSTGNEPCTAALVAEATLQAALLRYAQQFYRTPCCFFDVVTFLTPASATAIYHWATAPAPSAASETAPAEADTSCSSDDHTRYLLGLRCYIAMWEDAAEFATRGDGNAEGGSTARLPPAPAPARTRSSEAVRQQPPPSFTPTLGEMALLMELCARRFERSAPYSTGLGWSEEGLHDGYLLCAANIALYAHYFDVIHRRRQMEPTAKQQQQTPPLVAAVSCGGAATHPPSAAVVPLLARALGLLQQAPRRENNTAWLLCRCSLAALLRLADGAAAQKLALQAVQHDSMAHVGFWTLLPGLHVRAASGESGGDASAGSGSILPTWCAGAESYYSGLAKDCGDARRKVLRHFSWPAMRSIHDFELKQQHSLQRLVCTAHITVMELLACQTKQNVVDVAGRRRAGLQHALRLLSCEHQPPPPLEALPSVAERQLPELVDNTDWVVVKSSLLASTTSSRASALAKVIMPMPEPAALYSGDWGVPLFHALLLVCDFAALHELEAEAARRKKRQQQRGGGGGGGNKKKNRSSGGAAGDTSAANEAPRMTFEQRFATVNLLHREDEVTSDAARLSRATLPVLQRIFPALVDWLRSGRVEDAAAAAGREEAAWGCFSVEKAGPLPAEVRDDTIDSIHRFGATFLISTANTSSPPAGRTTADAARAFEAFLLPSGAVLLALLHVCKSYKKYLPVSEWATAVADLLTAAHEQLQRSPAEGGWASDEIAAASKSAEAEEGADTTQASSGTASGGATVARLQREKHSRLLSILCDFIADARAISRF